MHHGAESGSQQADGTLHHIHADEQYKAAQHGLEGTLHHIVERLSLNQQSHQRNQRQKYSRRLEQPRDVAYDRLQNFHRLFPPLIEL